LHGSFQDFDGGAGKVTSALPMFRTLPSGAVSVMSRTSLRSIALK